MISRAIIDNSFKIKFWKQWVSKSHHTNISRSDFVIPSFEKLSAFAPIKWIVISAGLFKLFPIIYTVLKAQDSTGRIASLIPEKGTLWLWVARLNLFLRYYSLFLNNILVSFVLG